MFLFYLCSQKVVLSDVSGLQQDLAFACFLVDLIKFSKTTDLLQSRVVKIWLTTIGPEVRSDPKNFNLNFNFKFFKN